MLDLQAQTEEILLPGGDEWILRVREKAFESMKRHDGCAQVIVCLLYTSDAADDFAVV